MLPSWIPVIFGFVTPISFTAGNLMVKYLNDEAYKINFTSDQLSNNPNMIIGVLGILIGISLWSGPNPV